MDAITKKGFINVGYMVHPKSEEKLFSEGTKLKWFEDELTDIKDVNYVFVAKDEIIYVGETVRSIRQRFAGGYYTGADNWKRHKNKGQKSHFKLWHDTFAKYDKIDIYVRRAEKITGEFGAKVSNRKIVEEDMIETFKPILNKEVK